jgi:hypothetical protein
MKFALRNFLQLEWGHYWLCRIASLLECELTHDWVFLLLLEMRKKLSMLVFAWNFEQIVMFSSAPTLGIWWMQWVVIAASHYHTSWRWWSAALWVMLAMSPTRLWPHSFLLFLLGFGKPDNGCYSGGFCNATDIWPSSIYIALLQVVLVRTWRSLRFYYLCVWLAPNVMLNSCRL